MLIKKGSSEQLTTNFNESEVYNASFGGAESFNLSDKTLLAGQIIRDYFGVPMRVNSSYRTVAHEIAQGRSGNSQHAKGKALDFSFLGSERENTLLKYHQEILNKGPLYNQLKQVGINGFGLYDTFLHIDSRATPAFWDNRITTKKKLQP